MICIEISLNGGLLWHVGMENAAALGAMLNTLFRRQSSAELLASGIYRLPDGRTAGGYWGESTPVQIGDVVRFALAESDSPTQPTQLHVVDSPEWQEAQRLMEALARTHVLPDTPASERRPGLAYRCSINGVYRAMATRKLQAEYLNCTLDWEARQPQQLHFRVGSGSASRPGHEWESERFRTSVSLGESIEIQVVPALALVEAPLGGNSVRSGGH